MSAVDTVALVANTSATDAELVGAVREGEDQAFEELFRRYHGRVRAFVAGRVADHGRADDVTQDVFLSALRHLRSTNKEIAFKPWVFEIARNASIDLHRRTSRAEEVPVDQLELVGADPPENEVLARERLAHLQGAFYELNEVHHRALVMRELEGRSYSEIGEQLSLTRPAVESVLFRARRRLAKEYHALRSRAAALLPIPFSPAGQASPGISEQATALVTVAALAVTGGALVDLTSAAGEPAPRPAQAPPAAGADQARPDAPQLRPRRSPAAGAERSADPGPARRARPSSPAAPAPRAEPDQARPEPTRDAGPQPAPREASELPQVEVGPVKSPEPAGLPDAVKTTPPLAIAGAPELPRVQVELAPKPILDALKRHTLAG